MFNVDDLKRRHDLTALVEADLGPPRRRNGRWLSWPCPFHQDSEQDGGSLRVTPDTGTWFCFGCQETGDVIKWVQKRQNLTFPEACRQLGGGQSVPASNPRSSPRTGPRTGPLASQHPEQQWRDVAVKILQQSQSYLWGPTGTNALDYLHKRGLTDNTIKHWGIGYNPGSYMVREIHTTDGKSAAMSKGHVIPVYLNSELRLLKIRQPDGYNPRYVRLAGGESVLFGSETLSNQSTILLTEGEFDAMLAWQEAGDLVGVASTTGGCKLFRREWLVYLLAAKSVLVAYDNDAAGDEAAAMVCKYSSRMQRVRVPAGKDITEYHQQGGNVRQWVESLLSGR